MYKFEVTKEKLNIISEMGLRFNIVDTYFKECGDKASKIYKILVDSPPISMKGSNTYNNDHIIVANLSFKNGDLYVIKSNIPKNTLLNILQDVKDMSTCEHNLDKCILVAEIKNYKTKYKIFCDKCIPYKIKDIADLEKALSKETKTIPNYIDIVIFTANLIKICEERGWVYNKESIESSSITDAWNRSILNVNFEYSSKYVEMAREYLEVFKTLEDSDSFHKRIIHLISKKYICYNDIKVVGWVYPKVSKIINRVEHSFFGTVGDNFECEATLVDYKSGYSKFGEYHIFKFKRDNSLIIYLGSSYFDLTLGNTYLISGKIKSHNLYRDIEKQTNISNLKVKEI